MVRSMIKHVLGVGSDHDGLYGKTSAYYGTVLTLHLHLLLWIDGAFSPQQIRDKMLSDDSEFRKDLISYLESVHVGELKTGTLAEVLSRQPPREHIRSGVHQVKNPKAQDTRSDELKRPDPTQTMPLPPPPICSNKHTSEDDACLACEDLDRWWQQFDETTDVLISRSNKGCLKNGVCMARFPRTVYEETLVSDTDGRIFPKQLEAMLNTVTPALTYLVRSNTDVSSLLSGTSVKSTISYVTDYVTKPALKTYQVFSSAYEV
ncbi:hypothetical protein CPC08DRAFT_650980 [Agrocybe pediades]|nr:hypothetical protein CPC08DRAFT_650980 [Agrocybe pediades]